MQKGSAMVPIAIGNKAPSGESSGAFPAPALAILHSPCGMRFYFQTEAWLEFSPRWLQLSIDFFSALPLIHDATSGLSTRGRD